MEDISFENQIQKIIEVFTFLQMPIAASSIFGNMLIIIVVASNKVTTTSIVFGILAGEDLLVTCMGPVMNIIILFSSTAQHYLNSVVAIHLNEFFGQTTAALSTWTLVVITTERFLSITIPFNVKHMITVKKVIFAEIAISIAVVAVQYLRLFLANRVVKIENRIFLLSTSPTWLLFYQVSDSVCFTLIPFMVIIIASLVIWIKLCTSFGQRHSQSPRSRSVTTNLLMANLTFLVTNIPFKILNTIAVYYSNMLLNLFLWMTIQYAFSYLMDLNHGLNFYVYILSGQIFREDVNRLFFSLKNVFNIK